VLHNPVSNPELLALDARVARLAGNALPVQEEFMQRYIARRALQSLLAIWVMTLVVFSLARISGNPLDVMLPLEAGPRNTSGSPSTGDWINHFTPNTSFS
jgi:hypothetical protein